MYKRQANQVSSTIKGDLSSRDFSINSIAFLFDNKSLFDPLNGLKDLELSMLRTHSEKNLFNDPLRILRCFRFVSELSFKIDLTLITFIKKNQGKLYLVANERINYEIQKIVKGANALDAVMLLKKFNIFGSDNFYEDPFFLDLILSEIFFPISIALKGTTISISISSVTLSKIISLI